MHTRDTQQLSILPSDIVLESLTFDNALKSNFLWAVAMHVGVGEDVCVCVLQ